MVADASAPNDVFINCPYDPGYARTFEALIFAIHALGFRARAAREVDDGGAARMERIIKIIGECRYGIHDLSRAGLDPNTGLARFNMPLELGVFLGAKHFGGKEQKKKNTLLLDIDGFRYRDFISDLAGMDPHAHGEDRIQAVREVRDWLASASGRKLPGGNLLVEQYQRFEADLPALAAAQGFNLAAIPYVDYLYFVTEWLSLDPGA